MLKHLISQQLKYEEDPLPLVAGASCQNPSLSALELSEQDIDSEILPLIVYLYQSGDSESKKIALTRLHEIQHSKLAATYLQQITAAREIE